MAFPLIVLSMEASFYLISCPPAIQSIWRGLQFWGLESHPIPLPSLHVGKRSSFPGFVLPSDMVSSKSVVGIILGDSGVVIGHQIDEFTCTWLAE